MLIIPVDKFLMFFIFLLTVINCVICVESVVRTSFSEAAGEKASSSQLPGSPPHRNKDLISAQFRAVQNKNNDDKEHESIVEQRMPGLAVVAPATSEPVDDVDDDYYMATSGSTYSPSKLRLNRYSQTGFFDPYYYYDPTYVGAYSSNIHSSYYYPYNNGNGYFRDLHPMADTYPYYERKRIRKLRERAMHQSSSSPYSSSSSLNSHRDIHGGGGGSGNSIYGYRGEGFRSNELDSTALGSSHEDHGGHGWGWGHKYTSKVTTNAIGLLGLLGLLSLLSNVLLQLTTTTTTTTAAMRRKRSTEDIMTIGETREEKRERIFREVLPYLTPFAFAKDGAIPVECTLHGLCMTNKVLVKEFGINGRAAGQRISNAAAKLLINQTAKENDKLSLRKSTGEMLKKTLELAGFFGRNQKECKTEYPICTTSPEMIIPSLPFQIRMQDLPQLISKFSDLTKSGILPMNL